MEEDRISKLPDGVLNHILSFLPTKSAIATGRLSRRWRHLWQHLSVLDFMDDYHYGYNSDESQLIKNFAGFVNSVLVLLRNPRGIRKMSLECDYTLSDDAFRQYSVETWVRASIGPHLEELNLNLFWTEDDRSEFKLPQSLFTSTNLVSLSLSGEAIHVHIQSSTEVSLMSLKRLLIKTRIAEVSSVNALLRGCPIIETLDLCFSPNHLDTVCIPPSIKWLKIIIGNDVGAYLEINAPDLRNLDITGITFGHIFSMYNLHNVVEACLDVFPQPLGSITPLHNLLGALSRTEKLELYESTTKWLLGEPHDLRFQEFQNLLCLEIVFPCFNPNSLLNSLLSLLQKCPMLQNLTIYGYKKQSPILGLAPPPSAPNCLVSHLTFIEFKGFEGFPDQVSFVEYLLQKGLVLKTMIIDVLFMELEKKYSILKMLCNLPRASATCQLTFD